MACRVCGISVVSTVAMPRNTARHAVTRGGPSATCSATPGPPARPAHPAGPARPAGSRRTRPRAPLERRTPAFFRFSKARIASIRPDIKNCVRQHCVIGHYVCVIGHYVIEHCAVGHYGVGHYPAGHWVAGCGAGPAGGTGGAFVVVHGVGAGPQDPLDRGQRTRQPGTGHGTRIEPRHGIVMCSILEPSRLIQKVKHHPTTPICPPAVAAGSTIATRGGWALAFGPLDMLDMWGVTPVANTIPDLDRFDHDAAWRGWMPRPRRAMPASGTCR